MGAAEIEEKKEEDQCCNLGDWIRQKGEGATEPKIEGKPVPNNALSNVYLPHAD